jgi:uncharacterized protein YecE (DUF72 family)
MPFDREQMKVKAAELAARGVYVGTSSWKYEGWLNQLYAPGRYEYRCKVATKRFERDCLSEYSEVFKTVCVDAAYYTFPRAEYLQGLADQVPDDFRFGFKVTDLVTIKKFPNHARHGAKAGQTNQEFLNADLFASAFLKPCEEIRPKIGVLMFEFSRFWPSDYEHGRDFVADLDKFLSQLPKGWPYAIEMRNKGWLREEYFACLAQRVGDLLKMLVREHRVTVALIEHNFSFVTEDASHAYVLRAGVVHDQGSTDEVLSKDENREILIGLRARNY